MTRMAFHKVVKVKTIERVGEQSLEDQIVEILNASQ
jgi:predicted P-loop ATPase/GTPase|tara:strand:+ start:1745 stop:1852 length:108 start_codon:yes stop_codon:yes gene_type:complete